ncbi:MAG: glycosyltransferase family 4 protein [Candidatus Altiarchaeota archaeon]|nr:glycosyltransferase family 4 protein [Candidatus Altiarchaeota archaeon]
MTTKVLFVRSNPVNPEPRVEKQALALAEENFDVNILGWDREGSHQRIEHRNEYTINRFRLKSSYGSLKLLFYIPIWWFYEFYYLMTREWDIIHACDFDTLLPAIIAAKIKKRRIVYDIFDFYSGMIPTGIPEIVIKIITFLENSFPRFADFVIVPNDSMTKHIKGMKSKRIITIMNIPKDLEYNNMFINSEKIDKFLIFYGGTFGKDRGLDEIIGIVEGIDDVQLVIAGYGADSEKIKDLCNNSNNSTFIGRLKYDEILAYTQKADMLFALYDPNIKNNIFASPNKLFEAMMLSKPIIVSDKTFMADIVKKERCGFVVDYRDTNSIKNAIIKLRDDPKLCKELGKNGENAHEKKYNWDIMKKRLLEIYNSLKE